MKVGLYGAFVPVALLSFYLDHVPVMLVSQIPRQECLKNAVIFLFSIKSPSLSSIQSKLYITFRREGTIRKSKVSNVESTFPKKR